MSPRKKILLATLIVASWSCLLMAAVAVALTRSA